MKYFVSQEDLEKLRRVVVVVATQSGEPHPTTVFHFPINARMASWLSLQCHFRKCHSSALEFTKCVELTHLARTLWVCERLFTLTSTKVCCQSEITDCKKLNCSCKFLGNWWRRKLRPCVGVCIFMPIQQQQQSKSNYYLTFSKCRLIKSRRHPIQY